MKNHNKSSKTFIKNNILSKIDRRSSKINKSSNKKIILSIKFMKQVNGLAMSSALSGL